jgi:hypothetical protein
MRVSPATFTFLLLVAPEVLGAQRSSACAPVDTTSLRVRKDFGDIASGTDAASAALRTKYHVPRTADSAVVLVQEAHVCASALAALNTDQNASHSQRLRTVIVLSIGNAYVVSDPTYKVGEWAQYTVFDSTFRTVLARSAG